MNHHYEWSINFGYGRASFFAGCLVVAGIAFDTWHYEHFSDGSILTSLGALGAFGIWADARRKNRELSEREHERHQQEKTLGS